MAWHPTGLQSVNSLNRGIKHFSDDTRKFAREYCHAVVDLVHGGNTAVLVQACLEWEGKLNHETAPLGPSQLILIERLARERNAAVKNRLLRDWLKDHIELVIEKWDVLVGFPQPPAAMASGRKTKLSEQYRAALPPLVVFDFDQTLSAHHTSPASFSDVINRVFGGHARLKMLKDMFEAISTAGGSCAISTFNSASVVRQAMDLVGLLTSSGVPAEEVAGFEDLDRSNPSKGELVRRRWSGGGSRRICFVDDDPNNIAEMAQYCPGAALLQVAGRTGLDQSECDQIVQWIRE